MLGNRSHAKNYLLKAIDSIKNLQRTTDPTNLSELLQLKKLRKDYETRISSFDWLSILNDLIFYWIKSFEWIPFEFIYFWSNLVIMTNLNIIQVWYLFFFMIGQKGKYLLQGSLKFLFRTFKCVNSSLLSYKTLNNHSFFQNIRTSKNLLTNNTFSFSTSSPSIAQL